MKKIKILIGFLLLSSSLFSQEALTLDHAVAIALENNLNIKVARSDAEITSNKASRGNAGLLPTLGAGINTNYSEHASDELSSSGSLNFSYTLFDGFGGQYSYKLLNLQKDQADLSARYQIEFTIANVITGFYDISEKSDDLLVAGDNLAISKDRLKRNEAKYEYGNINKLEVLNAKVDFNRDSSSYLKAQQNYDEAARELNVLLGRSVETELQIIPDASDFRVFDLNQLKDEALNNNADYLIKRSQLEASEISEKKAKSSQLPSLKLTSNYNYYENKIAGTNSNSQLSGGLSLSMNIFDGKKKRITIANAKIEKQISVFQEQEQRLQLEKDIVHALASYEYNLQLLSLEEDALEASKLNFEQSREYYHLGQISSTTYREAQLNYVEAQNKRSAARYQAKRSEINIKKISGSLLK
ncbi:TolC family protein [Ancylomarina sp. DW003]|nr:TolC family protein [Ancylomarina sp. DW003]MDE5423543.1 TolC family protein [Ancylomarina sp. DW003]